MNYKPNLAGPWVDVRSFARSDKPRDNNYSNDPNFDYDWYQPIQDAIDYLVSLPPNGDTGTLYLPPGWYRISKPLRVRRPLPCPTKKDPNAFCHEYCSIHIVGDSPGYGAGGFHGTAITCDFADGPALILQSMRATKIENIVFRGKNNWTASHDMIDMATHYDDTNYVVSGVRDDRCSPHAGIHIDPYDPCVPSTHRYPGLESEYLTSPGSSQIQIHNCQFLDFVVGVGISLNGYTQNAENIAIVDCSFLSNKSAIAIGQDQSRNVTCRNLVAAGARVIVDCIGYGKGSGNAPSIFGANIGGAKYLFQTFAWGGQVTVTGLYSEAIYSVGNIGAGASADPHVFSGCVFNFSPTPANKPVLDLRLASAGIALFSGCAFNLTGTEPMYAYSERTAFHHCTFGTGGKGDNAPSFWNIGFPELTSFTDCFMSMTPDGARLSNIVPYAQKAAISNAPMLPGTLFYGLDAIDANDTGKALRWVSGQYPKLDLGSVLVTINTDGTATFPVPSGFDGRIAVGDFIQTDTTYKCLFRPSDGISVSLRLGKVSAVTSSTITVNYVPKAVLDDYIKNSSTSQPSLSYTLHAEYLPRVHLSTVGLVDLAISNVDIVMMAPNYNTAPWQKYDRIRDKQNQILEGTYVADVDGKNNKITLSRPLPAGTPSTLDLYGADVRGINTIQVF